VNEFMSAKDAPPETEEQARMIAFYKARGSDCGWGRDKHGNFLASYARDAWAAWQAAAAPAPYSPTVAQLEQLREIVQIYIEYCEEPDEEGVVVADNQALAEKARALLRLFP
jgi:hypothetical protein